MQVSLNPRQITSLFTLTTPTIITIVLVYVDDILIASNDLSQIEAFKTVIFAHFKSKDLSLLKHFRCLKVARFSKGIFLNQQKYTLHILNDSGHLGSQVAHFPMEQNLKLTHQNDTLLPNPNSYQYLVGRLIYLIIIRLDIIFTINIFGQFMHTSYQPHMQAVTRIFRYIKSCPGKDIFFPSSSSL